MFRRKRTPRDFREEIEAHLTLETERLREQGMSNAEAQSVARRAFGNVTRASERFYETGRWIWRDTLAADLRYAVRALRRTPGFTLAVLATFGLGIGANTAVFTVINTVLLQPLPYPDAGSIVRISGPKEGPLSESAYIYLAQHNPGWADLSGYRGFRMTLNGGDRPELADVVEASRNYFALFGGHPLRGRTFSAAEDRPGGSRVLVVSYSLWQQSFGGDPSLLGRRVTLGGAPFTIIGVLSPRFQPYPPADAWIPLQAGLDSANPAGILNVAARLPRGTTVTGANAQVAALGRQYGRSRPTLGDSKLELTPLQQYLTGDVQPALWILLGAVALLLLITCANVANLLLARAANRRREIAIRAAIGARRARIARQLLTESLVLALGGGALGLVAGSWAVQALLALIPSDLPRIQEMAAVPGLDPRVAAFTALLAIGTGILCGLFPVLQLAPAHLTLSLSESARAGAGRTHTQVRDGLVIAEVGMSVVLLCGAVLLIRSFAAMHSTPLGLDPHNVLTAQFSLVGKTYAHAAEVDRLARRAVANVESLPGVESAAFASTIPFWGQMDMIFNIPGRQLARGQRFTGDVQWVFVSPRYFDVLRIPLVAGRGFRDQEPGRTVIINQRLAGQYFRNSNPVGRSILLGPGLGTGYEVGIAEIIGVVGDIREHLNGGPWATIYQPPSQIPDADMTLVNSVESPALLLRTRPGVAPFSLCRPVERVLRAGSSLSVGKIRTLDQAASDSIARQNFDRDLLGLFAAIALLLAAVGIYGVLSYGIAQRTRELGIRAALGAERRDILGLILRQAGRLALLGVAGGLAAAFGLTRLLRAELFGVQPHDPLTFFAVPFVLLTVAFTASALPALRASRIDPLTALRHE